MVLKRPNSYLQVQTRFYRVYTKDPEFLLRPVLLTSFLSVLVV